MAVVAVTYPVMGAKHPTAIAAMAAPLSQVAVIFRLPLRAALFKAESWP
jgi:hypothetical protein